MSEANPYKNATIEKDDWQELKKLTKARIALGRTGVSIPLKECLAFQLAHAHARDAVFSTLDTQQIASELEAFGMKSYLVHSCAKDRTEYLQRPDLGKKLLPASYQFLKELILPDTDICFVIADGLSATAVNKNAVPLIHEILPMLHVHHYSTAPIILATQARVAIADSIGYLLNAKMVINLIGERPGLSACDSMGAYLTFGPEIGLTDERRNCISNIRAQGLDIKAAAAKMFYLIVHAFQLRTTGILLKDNDDSEPTAGLL